MNLSVRVKAARAAFIGPKRDEPMSYSVMTPSAAGGVVEAILWKPAVRVVVDRIHVGAPLGRYFGYLANEVKDAGSTKVAGISIEESRDQRYLVGLRDVDYLIDFHFVMTDRKGTDDSVVKFQEMFTRRIEKGQCYSTPYAGRRDFTFAFDVPGDFKVHKSLLGKTIDLGMVTLGFDYSKKPHRPAFFHAVLKDGVLVEKGRDRIPDIQELLGRKESA